VRGRIWRVGTVIAVGALSVGVAVAPAKKTKGVAKGNTVASTCHANVATAIPAGSSTVTPASEDGTQYGSVVCGKLGRGVQASAFTSLSSGDLQGKYTDYFGAGSVRGTYALTPADTSVTPSSFASVAYAGTVTIDGGTGIYRLAKGKGTLTCSSSDGLHMSCTTKLKLTRT
jgi:TctA family transporter